MDAMYRDPIEACINQKLTLICGEMFTLKID